MDKRKIKHEFRIEATWDPATDEFVSFDCCQVVGESSRLAGLISAICIKEPSIKAVIDRAVLNIKEHKVEPKEEKKENSSTPEDNILKMSDEDLETLARKRFNDRS
jgi:hypothetical protein